MRFLRTASLAVACTLHVVTEARSHEGSSQVTVIKTVFSADGGNVSAAVIDTAADSLGGLGIRLMRYGDCLLGGMFLDEEFKTVSPFTAFNLMAYGMDHVAKAQTHPRSMLQLGLGAGSVPMLAKHKSGYDTVDALENSTVVKDFAINFFGYDAGPIILAEASGWIFSQLERGEDEKYDFIAQDLYMGWNPTHMLNRAVFEHVKRNLLSKTQGVYLVNFIGFFRGEYRQFSLSVVKTLRQVFNSVECFRDTPLNFRELSPANTICFATDHSHLIDFLGGKEPDHEKASIPMESLSLLWLEENFQHWRIVPKLETNDDDIPTIESTTHDLAPFLPSFKAAEQEMRDSIRPYLPEDLWFPESVESSCNAESVQ